MKLRRYLLPCIALVIAIVAMAVPVTAQLNEVEQGETVFIGESGLDITNTLDGNDMIAWWAPGLDVWTEEPSAILTVSVPTNFEISPDPDQFGGRIGNWYQYDGNDPDELAFLVQNATGDVAILNLEYPGGVDYLDVTDGTALIGDFLDFKVKSDLYLIQMRDTGEDFDFKIEVTNPGGVKYSKLWTNVSQKDLDWLNLISNPWYWSSEDGIEPDYENGWKTDKIDPISDFPVYTPGTYTVKLKCSQNGLNFESASRTITLEEEQPVLTITPSSLIRGNRFYTTVQGIPNTYYLIWIKDCIACPNGCCSDPMSGACCDQPPMIVDGQDGVIFDDQYQYPIGDTLIEWCGCLCTERLYGIVPHSPSEGRYYYALVLTDENGERTIEWQTSTCTAPTSYKIHTQRWIPDDVEILDPSRPFAEGCVFIQKGIVTLQTEVCGILTDSTYLGETVRVFGQNTDSRTTYLFIKGPCQSCVGDNMTVTNSVVNGDPSTFTAVPVRSDGSWEYFWYTRELQIDLGQYTIYATSMPNDGPTLEGVPCHDCSDLGTSCAAWTKKPFTFLKPTITGDINPKIIKIVCCSPPSITVSGEATGLRGESIGQHYNTVPLGLWVFGENKVAGEKYIFKTIDIDCPTGDYSADLASWINTLGLQPGTYTVIVQHPMYNQRLDIIPEAQISVQPQWYSWWDHWWGTWEKEVWYPDANKKFVVTASPVRWSKLFIIEGPDRLVGTAALQALLNGFNDPNIDDEILVLTFKVESNTALQADFSGTPQTGSKPLEVLFTDISAGSPATWFWTFGDGYTSTDRNPTHLYANEGTYDVTLTVTGLSGSSSTTKAHYITVTGTGPTPTVTPTPTPPGGNVINLYAGWNFISTPKTLADGQNTAGVVFSGVNTGGHSIYLYDASIGIWQAMGSSSQVKPLDGIWIYSTGAKQVTLTFKNDPLALPPTKAVYTGWNAIGFSDVYPASAKDTLQSVNVPPNQWTTAIGFNAAGQSYETSIINGGSGSHSDTNPMNPTKGYWLNMNGPGILAAISA